MGGGVSMGVGDDGVSMILSLLARWSQLPKDPGCVYIELENRCAKNLFEHRGPWVLPAITCRRPGGHQPVMTEPNGNDYLSVITADDGSIVVTGDVDIGGGPVLEAALHQRGNDHRLILDLGGVSFMDSSGLRNLLTASRRAREHGADVVLRNVGPLVWRLLEITGTAEQFAVESRRA